MFKNKRILAFLLALVMVFGTVLPVTSFADDGDDTSTETVEESNSTDEGTDEPEEEGTDEPGVSEETDGVNEVFFRVFNQNGVEQSTKAEGTQIQSRDRTTAEWGAKENVTANFYPETENTVYRLHSIKLIGEEEFEDGYYKVTVGNYVSNAEGDPVTFEFQVENGKIVAQGDDKLDGTQAKPFKVSVYTAQANYKVYVRGDNKENRAVTVHRIARTEDGKMRVRNGRPVLGDQIANLGTTDAAGYAGINYEINDDGTITFPGDSNNIVRKKEFLAVTLDGSAEEAQVLVLWRVKDEVKADYEANPDTYKEVLTTLVQNIEALESQISYFIASVDTDITLRVRIETAGFRKDRVPVTNSTVKISKPSTIEHGKVVGLGEEVQSKKTNEAGYVEFKLPKEDVVKMFQYNVLLPEQYTSYEGNIRLTDQTVPYLITQEDNGGMEGVIKSDEIYTLANATPVDGTDNVFELLIINDMDLAYRIAGKDRYETAVKIAEENYPKGLQKFDGKTRVIIANGERYPDALTATTTSYYYNAPLLLVTKDSIPEATLKYIETHKPDEIVVIGGEAAISEKVCLDLQEAADAQYLNRIYGKDRYGTSVANADNLLKLKNDSTGNTLVKGFFGNEAKIVVAAGDNFPDALAVAAPAADKGYPLLLVGKDYYPPVVKEWIEDNFVKNAYIIGGEAAISKDVQLQIGKTGSVAIADRDYGRDRSATSVIIGQTFFPNTDHVYVTSGAVFADALTGSTLAAKNGRPVILLPNADTVSDEIVEYLENSQITKFTVLGGDATVSPAARAKISNILMGK